MIEELKGVVEQYKSESSDARSQVSFFTSHHKAHHRCSGFVEKVSFEPGVE